MNSFVARAMAWWLRLFFHKRQQPAAPESAPARRVGYGDRTFRAVPAGVDREAYRKVQRAARKFQRKIEQGKMTEAEALKALGLEVE